MAANHSRGSGGTAPPAADPRTAMQGRGEEIGGEADPDYGKTGNPKGSRPGGSMRHQV